MPVNTLKALKERRAAAVANMKTAHEKLKANGSDADARKAFDTANAEVASLAQSILDEERIEQVEAEARAFNGKPNPGGEDRTFGTSPEKDDPIAFLDSSKYSLLRAIDQLAEGRAVTGYEGEISAELNKRFGTQSTGFRVPLNLRLSAAPERRDLTLTTGAGALDVMQERGTIIQFLRNRMVTAQLGATVLSDMVGTFELPKVTGDVSFTWGGESGSVSGSNSTVGKITFAPTTVGAQSIISRRFRKQTSIDAENFQRNELLTSLAVAGDSAALAGSGSSNQPLGLINNTSTNIIALGTNGAALTWADIINFETLVANLNADDVSNMGYCFNAKTRGKLKSSPKISGYPVFLWENGDTPVNGYAAAVTNLLASNLTKGSSSGVCSAALFGCWKYLTLAYWGGADIVVDPYTGAAAGDMKITVLQDMQVKNRYDEGFTRCVDVLTV